MMAKYIEEMKNGTTNNMLAPCSIIMGATKY